MMTEQSKPVPLPPREEPEPDPLAEQQSKSIDPTLAAVAALIPEGE